MTHYDASYKSPFRIGSRVRLNPNFAALYPPRVRARAQDSGIVGAHLAGERSNVHFNDGTEYTIRDEHLLAGWEPQATPAPAPPVEQVVCRRTVNRRGRGGSSGSPLSPDACPAGLDPRHCDATTRQPWASDPRFYRCTSCGKCGRLSAPAPAAAVADVEGTR